MNIYNYFANTAKRSPNLPCIYVNGQLYNYQEVKNSVCKIAKAINTSYKNIGILCYKSLSAYTGILATLKTGNTYVPLNPKFPANRNLSIIKSAQVQTIIVDNSSIEMLLKIIDNLDKTVKLILPQTYLKDLPEQIKANYHVIDKEDIKKNKDFVDVVMDNKLAYIMFTSGSTGIPKGVPISHSNVSSYVNYMFSVFNFEHTNRFSQTFDITFDLSVHDMFLCWRSSASLYCIPDSQNMAPAKFINSNSITVWFSVPSVIQFMSSFRMLKENAFPSIKYSLFCGEPLPKTLAIEWQNAAQNSIVENIYGPTETTIGITHYRLPNDKNQIKSKHGIISIGKVFKGQNYCLINEHNEIVEDEGELCLAGSQVAKRYWLDENKTNEQFVTLENSKQLWYKTGDIVKEENNELFYLSRKDLQIKLRGYRIELNEINLEISKFINSSLVYTIPFPIKNGIAGNLYAFLPQNCGYNQIQIIKHLKNNLPNYMIPKEIIFVEKFQLNANGKIDRNYLINILKERENGKNNS